MDTERMKRESMQTMMEVRKLQLLHRRKKEILGPEFRFLRMVEQFQQDHPEVPGIYVNELAACTGVTKSSVSKSLHKLEQRGMVTRTVDPNDRRNTFVSLTPEGKAFCTEQHTQLLAVLTCVTADIGEQRYYEIMTGIRELTRAFARAVTATEQNQSTEEEKRCDPFSEI